MDVITGGPGPSRPLCLMIGNFDGVHLGHQALLTRARALADRHGCATAVLSFQPHPLKVLRPDKAPRLLQTPDQKRALLAFHGLDYYVEQAFDEALYTLSPEAFVARLKERLDFRFLLVGFNFRFGYKRAGDTATLKALETRHGYETLVQPPSEDAEGPISSSRIRALVRDGRTEDAARLLGRPYFLEGTVAAGQALGREMATRTANFQPGNELSPRHGVYAGWCRPEGAGWYRAISNFGKAPTVGRNAPLCETHLFDFDGSLYGRRVVVTLGAFLRPEKTFSDVAALRTAIAADVAHRLSLPDTIPPDLPQSLGAP